MAANSKNIGSKFLALVLMVGGVLGIGVAFALAQHFLRVHWIYGVLVAAFLGLFVWSVLTGYRLWRGEARGWRWALILFAMQIPVLAVPGLSYEYYTGISLKLLGGHADKKITLSLGAEANFFLDTRVTDLVYGANLFAMAATVFLLVRRPRSRPDGVTQS